MATNLGKPVPTKGMRIKVYEDPFSREVLEGMAIIVKRYENESSDEQWRVSVRFDGKDESNVDRWVHQEDVDAAARVVKCWQCVDYNLETLKSQQTLSVRDALVDAIDYALKAEEDALKVGER